MFNALYLTQKDGKTVAEIRPLACRWASDVTRAVCCFHQDRHRALDPAGAREEYLAELTSKARP